MNKESDYEAKSILLIDEYLKTNDSEFLMKLYNLHLGLFYKIASKFIGLMEMNDLMQECYIGLYKAVITYDSTRGEIVKYISWTVHNHIYRAIQKNNGIEAPEYMNILISKYYLLIDDLQGQKISDEYIAYKLGVSEETVSNIKKAISGRKCISIEEPISDDGGTIEDVIADEFKLEESCIDDLFTKEIQERIIECINEAPGDDGKLLKDKYIIGKSYADIDRSKSVSRNKIKVEKALKRFKRDNQVKLKPLYDELIFSKSSNGFLNSVKRFNRTWESSVESIVMKQVEKDN